MKFISGRNYYNDEDFKKMCQALEKGEHIKVVIDCIGHTRNNNEQEAYRQALLEKYGDKLEVNCNKGAYSYDYDYKLDITKLQNE